MWGENEGGKDGEMEALSGERRRIYCMQDGERPLTCTY